MYVLGNNSAEKIKQEEIKTPHKNFTWKLQNRRKNHGRCQNRQPENYHYVQILQHIETSLSHPIPLYNHTLSKQIFILNQL